jgi:hypothetical protein
MIVDRRDMRQKIADILSILYPETHAVNSGESLYAEQAHNEPGVPDNSSQ